MTTIRIWAGVALIASSVAVAGSHIAAGRSAARAAQAKNERSRLAFSHDLPQLNGDKLTVTVVEVNYGPSESSPPHRHPCPVIGYVVQGTLRTQVKGEPEAIYKAGQSFYEAPNGVHLVSANASDRERTKLLAYFVCDQHTALSVDVPDRKPAGEQ
jgi:quercetin dioxygenase-like cupin family protein